MKLKLKSVQCNEEREILLFDVKARAEELFGINRRGLCIKEDEERLGRT